MNLAVVDDNQNDIHYFAALAESYCKENKIQLDIQGFQCGEDFLESPLLHTFDAAVIDIYMSGINGIQTAQRLTHRFPRCKIIFVTTSSDYALEGFDVGAVHYLVKPVDSYRVQAAVDRLMECLHIPAKYIEMKSGRDFKKILLSDIYYVDYYAHAVQVHMDQDEIKSFMKFTDIQQELMQNPNFLWCYRNIIVNMDRISQMENREILLQNGIRLPVNKQKTKEIRTAYADYIFNKAGGTGL